MQLAILVAPLPTKIGRGCTLAAARATVILGPNYLRRIRRLACVWRTMLRRSPDAASC